MTEETEAGHELPASPADNIQWVATESLVPSARNARTHSDAQVAEIAASIREWGWTVPVLVDEAGELIAGHGRLLAARKLGIERVPAMTAEGWTEGQKRAYRIADNKLAEHAGWDTELLRVELGELQAEDFDIGLVGFGADELAALGLGGDASELGGEEPKGHGSLAERFGAVPFSVLDARGGWWQERKQAWLSLGIRSELGRDENLLRMSDTVRQPDPEKRQAAQKARELGEEYEGGDAWGGSGTSIFDPVLCELAYRWFCPPGGAVLDPFAGGSVRGLVASRLGRAYTGIELSGPQVQANRAQAESLAGEPTPEWLEGDSSDADELLDKDFAADFVFSCPPYADLEVYSDHPRDISAMSYEDFCAAYSSIIERAVARLKNNRFACFVVGEVRDKAGNYRGFVPYTIRAFEEAGARFYNEGILVTSVGSLAIRIGRIFSTSRKLGKTHQNVLVFVKGDGRKAAEAVGEVEYAEPQKPGEGAGDDAGDDAGDSDGEQPDEQFGEPL